MNEPIVSPSPSRQASCDHQQVHSSAVRSTVGKAQTYLSGVLPRPFAPQEHLLLCRYANTIDDSCGLYELRQLQRLVRHLEHQIFERRHGYADPRVAREVEKEIVLRGAPEYSAGHDLSPAMRLLEEYEREGPMFTQPERNLLLRAQFCSGDLAWVEGIAQDFREKQCSRRKIIDICRTLEQTELSWVGFDTMDGMTYPDTKAPGFAVIHKNPNDPMAHYPPFALYPALNLPLRSAVLQNGTLLLPDQEGWWRAGIKRVDQTFTAPHFYKADGQHRFEIADEEHRFLFQQRTAEPRQDIQMGGMSL